MCTPKRATWTHEETLLLIANSDKSVSELCGIISKSEKQILNKLDYLRRKGVLPHLHATHTWTVKQVSYLINNPHEPTKKLAQALNLPEKLINSKLYHLRKSGQIPQKNRYASRLEYQAARIAQLEQQLDAVVLKTENADIINLVLLKLKSYHENVKNKRALPHEYHTIKEVYRLLTGEEFRYRKPQS